ncbi:TonB-dependent receptor [Alcaligenaceae bacterium]|nr:TonB-dependent receptor [Alcaligenaceae bacterium]
MKSNRKIKRAKTARRLRPIALLLSPIFTSLAIVSTAYGQSSPTIAFKIPPGSLSDAIDAFGQQAGLRISYPKSLAAGKQSAGITGQVSATQALASILEGSGLSYSYSNTNTIFIRSSESNTARNSGSERADSNSSDSDSRSDNANSGTSRNITTDTSNVNDGTGRNNDRPATATTRSTSVASPLSGTMGDHLTLDTITVKGKLELDPADEPYRTPGSSAYLSSEDIERFRGTSVGDFLSGIPGVMNADSRNSGAVDVNIRGMQGQGRVPVLVDGATQETAIWQGYNGATPRTYIDPDFIGSISIEKGISSAPDATGATGGVVRASIIGVDDILLPGKTYGIRLKGGLTTNSSRVPTAGTEGGWNSLTTDLKVYGGALPPDDLVFHSRGMRRPPLFKPTGGSGSMVVATTTDYIDFVAGFVRRENGNYHAGRHGGGSAHLVAERNPRFGNLQVGNGGLSDYRAGEEILNTSLDNKSWMLKATVKLVPSQSLELGYRKYLSDYGHLLSSRLFGAPYQSWLSSIDLDTYTARYRWKPQDNNLVDLRIDAYLSAVDNRINVLDLIESQVGSGSNQHTVKTFHPFYQWTESKRWGARASNTSHFKGGAGDFTLSYGAAFVREDTGLPSGVDRNYYISMVGGGAPREGWREEGSGFAKLDWQPYKWLTASASTRYSHFTTLDNYFARTTKFRRQDGGWSPIFSLMVEPHDGFQVYTKFGKAVRAPSIFESLTGTSLYDTVEDNNLKLERARNLEIGANFVKKDAWRSGDKLRIHAAYFNNHIDDYLTRVGKAREILGRPGRYIEMLARANLDYAEMRGLEASMDYDTGRYFGSIGWSHYTHVMFCARKGVLLATEPICQAGGLPHSYSLQQVPPRNTVALKVGARLLEKKLEIGSRASYIGSRFAPGIGRNIGVSGVVPSRWKPYTMIDVYSSYKLNDNVSFDLAIDNLTDRYYMDALNAAQMPAPGRTIRGNVTITF